MGEPTLKERLAALAAFVPVFEGPDFVFGEWQGAAGQMPWFRLSDDARSFVSTASRFGWVVPGFDWPSWQRTEVARHLLSNPQSIETATAEDLERLLTVHVRLDRFSEGHLASAFESGQLPAIARRAAALLKECRGLDETASGLR